MVERRGIAEAQDHRARRARIREESGSRAGELDGGLGLEELERPVAGDLERCAAVTQMALKSTEVRGGRRRRRRDRDLGDEHALRGELLQGTAQARGEER